MDTRCVVAIVERGKAEKIIKAAKAVGASGVTTFYGRGTSDPEAKKFLNVHIEPSKEIILILTEEKQLKKIMKAMIEEGRLKDPGVGIIFSVKIDHLIGLQHRKNSKDLKMS